MSVIKSELEYPVNLDFTKIGVSNIDMDLFKNITQSELAKAIGVSPQAIHGWKLKGRVPAERVVQVEKATGIDRKIIRPDLYA